ncbi:MAG: linear amide C-N hydrolase [Mycobacterium sp.]|nr:linear amide C-N hydrolase [Mycobacterium sp.]
MCTRVLWNTNDLAVVTGRSMDWPESTQPLIVAFPPGRQREGFNPPGTGNDPNPLHWTSRHASLVTTLYGVGTIDGLNDAGLAGHGLYLQATDFGSRDPSKPAAQTALWLQYLLDQAATVQEALALMDDIQLVKITVNGHDSNIHLALEDKSGDSAIIELAGGRPVIHHGRQFTLMTNDPTYDEQLALLSGQDFSHPSRDMPLPGNVNAVDRFQRAAYYSALLPTPASEREAVASVMAIMRNVSVPFGAPYAEFGVYNTEYRTVTDLTNRMYFFELTTSPNVIWVHMDRLDLAEGSPTLAVDPYDETLVGDVTDRFVPREMPF